MIQLLIYTATTRGLIRGLRPRRLLYAVVVYSAARVLVMLLASETASSPGISVGGEEKAKRGKRANVLL